MNVRNKLECLFLLFQPSLSLLLSGAPEMCLTRVDSLTLLTIVRLGKKICRNILGPTTLSITTFSIMTQLKGLICDIQHNENQHYDTQHNNTVIMLSIAGFFSHAECYYAEYRYTECHYAECHYAECRYAECC